MTNLKNIRFKAEAVARVYSGKANKCCCGCSGKYTYASKFAEAANQYDAVRDATVKSVVTKVNAALNNGAKYMVDSDFVSVDVGARMYTLYFR